MLSTIFSRRALQTSINKMSTQLGQRLTVEVNTNLTLLENESKLKERVSELSDMCNDRLRKLKELKDAEKELCYILTEKPCDVPGGIVPSVEQLEHLQEHILGLEQEKSRRLAEYRSTKRTIINLSSELEIPPSSQFEIEVVSGGDLFKPSAYNMEQLRSYSKELENKKQSHQQLAVQLRSQIKTMWTRLDISEDSMKISVDQ